MSDPADPPTLGPGTPDGRAFPRCRLRVAADFSIADADGDVHAVLGWEVGKIAGRSMYELVHPMDLGELRRSHEEWLKSPFPSLRKYRLRRSDGSYAWVASNAVALRDEEDHLTGADLDVRRLDEVKRFTDVRAAIEESRLVLHYQPIVSLATGAVTQIEALVRWQRDEGLVAPGEFVPFAERTGLIRPLTRWVLARALADRTILAKSWRGVRIAVNCSLSDLGDPLFAVGVLAMLAEHRVRPKDLVLEVTESSVAEADGYVHARLQQLAGEGVVIALDDFGAGESSLGRLASMPIRELKVDQSLAAHPGHNAELFRIVTAVGRDRGLRVIAEGVERGEQLEMLRALGVAEIQGLLFAPAMPLADLTEWLRERDTHTAPGS